MQITATNDHGETADVTEAVQIIYDAMHAYMGMASGSLDAEEWDAVLHLAKAAQFPDYADLENQRRLELEAEERRQRARDEMARTQAERRAEAAKAAAQLAKEMREREPALVRAGWSDSELVTLHQMRTSGMA